MSKRTKTNLNIKLSQNTDTYLQKLIKKMPTHLFVASLGWVCRIINVSIQVISIPLLLRFLGIIDYAAFAIITGLLAWYNLADIGLGPSIQNEISYMRVQKFDAEEFLRSIAIYIIIIGFLEVVIFSSFAFSLQKILFRHLNITYPNYLLALVGSAYILIAIFSISSRIFFAQQKGYWGYIYQSAGIVLGFITILLLIFFDIKHKLVWIMMGWTIPQVIMSFVGFLHAMPNSGWLKKANFKTFRRLLTTAWGFSFNSIGGTIVLGLDYVIISQILNVNEIVTYNVVNKIFTVIFFGYSAILTALWPTMAENYASKNKIKIQKTNDIILRNVVLGSIYIFLASIIVVLTKNFIIHYLANAKLTISALLILLFGFYYIIRVWSDTYTTAILSRNKTTFLTTMIPFQAIIGVISTYYLGIHFGLIGIVLGFILCFSITSLWLTPCYHYYLSGYFRKIRHIHL